MPFLNVYINDGTVETDYRIFVLPTESGKILKTRTSENDEKTEKLTFRRRFIILLQKQLDNQHGPLFCEKAYN